jgi:DNA-directed RNA polymerase subunit beta'
VVAGDKKSSFDENFDERIYSRTIAVDVKDAKGKVILPVGTIIDKDNLKILNDNKVTEVDLRSVLTCETEG